MFTFNFSRRSLRRAIFLAISFFLAIPAYSQVSFWIDNDGSDYYIYCRYSGLHNACAFFPSTTVRVSNNVTNVVTTMSSAPASYTGTGLATTFAPNSEASCSFVAIYTGTFCNYSTDVYNAVRRMPHIKAPSNVQATDEIYDDKVIVTWTASPTDVPTSKYGYRIYRKVKGSSSFDAGFPILLAAGTTSWTDT